MAKHLFDPDLLDRLEGLNERYALLTRRNEELHDEAAAYDRPPDPTQLASFETLRHKVKNEVEEIVREVLGSLEKQ